MILFLQYDQLLLYISTAPEDVKSPGILEATATSLFLTWEPPGKPNGEITGYFLYVDGVEVFRGGEQVFLVTGLRVRSW